MSEKLMDGGTIQKRQISDDLDSLQPMWSTNVFTIPSSRNRRDIMQFVAAAKGLGGLDMIDEDADVINGRRNCINMVHYFGCRLVPLHGGNSSYMFLDIIQTKTAYRITLGYVGKTKAMDQAFSSAMRLMSEHLATLQERRGGNLDNQEGVIWCYDLPRTD